jgi:hypothetical protein
MKQERRGSWYLLTALVLGAAMGLVYSWVINPVKYVDAPPYALRADYKDDYRALAASAFLYSNDLVRVQARLAELKDDGTFHTITLLAQRAQADGRPDEEVRALSALALALGRGVTPPASSLPRTLEGTSAATSSLYTPTPLLIEPTANPTITLETTLMPLSMIRTPNPSGAVGHTPTETPTPTQGAPFVLQDTRLVCNAKPSEPLIQVELLDAAGQPVPSVEFIVTWEGGEDHFFTGLQPELGLGYADFTMQLDVVYSIRPAAGGQPVDALAAAQCVSEDGSQYWGSWYLTFVQP